MAIYECKIPGPIEYVEAFGLTGIDVVYTRADYDLDGVRHILYETANGSGWSVRSIGPAGSKVSENEEKDTRRRLPKLRERLRFFDGCPQPGYREEMWTLLGLRNSKYAMMTPCVKLELEKPVDAEKDRLWCFGDFLMGDLKGFMRAQVKPKKTESNPPRRLIMTEIFFKKPLLTYDLTGVEVLLAVAGAMMLKTENL